MDSKAVIYRQKGKKTMELWNGFETVKETVAGRETVIVFPKKGTENGKWALKTEYFDAFPNVQLQLLELGYHIAYIKNITRWHVPEDTEARAALAKHMNEKYNVSKKCVIIGMSCGGMQGIYFAAKYPEYVSCMYLDAPVVNLLSCPAGLGNGISDMLDEFINDKKMSFIELLSYRNHPLDSIPKLLKSDIPVILVCGDSDTVVPYEENGKLLKDAYEKSGKVIKTIIKKGCDHHPHSLEDNTPIIEFIQEYDR